jgi:hypothetical protein
MAHLSLQLGSARVVPFTAPPYYHMHNGRDWRLRALRAAGIAVGDIWRRRPRRRFRYASISAIKSTSWVATSIMPAHRPS